MRHAEPTGRWRFRVNTDWRGRQTIVLQIEVEGLHTSCIGGHIDTERLKFWHDARLQDIHVAGLMPEMKFSETVA